MMLETAMRPADNTTDLCSGELEMRLADRDWVARRFSAILEGSGFQDHMANGSRLHFPRDRIQPYRRPGVRWTEPGLPRQMWIQSRVRSPPTPR